MVSSASRKLLRACLAVLAVAVVSLASAQSASARYASQSEQGTYVEVCAESLTHHFSDGSSVVLHTGHDYYIQGFGYAGSAPIVWGTNQGGRYGWVYNGYFC